MIVPTCWMEACPAVWMYCMTWGWTWCNNTFTLYGTLYYLQTNYITSTFYGDRIIFPVWQGLNPWPTGSSIEILMYDWQRRSKVHCQKKYWFFEWGAYESEQPIRRFAYIMIMVTKKAYLCPLHDQAKGTVVGTVEIWMEFQAVFDSQQRIKLAFMYFNPTHFHSVLQFLRTLQLSCNQTGFIWTVPFLVLLRRENPLLNKISWPIIALWKEVHTVQRVLPTNPPEVLSTHISSTESVIWKFWSTSFHFTVHLSWKAFFTPIMTVFYLPYWVFADHCYLFPIHMITGILKVKILNTAHRNTADQFAVPVLIAQHKWLSKPQSEETVHRIGVILWNTQCQKTHVHILQRTITNSGVKAIDWTWLHAMASIAETRIHCSHHPARECDGVLMAEITPSIKVQLLHRLTKKAWSSAPVVRKSQKRTINFAASVEFYLIQTRILCFGSTGIGDSSVTLFNTCILYQKNENSLLLLFDKIKQYKKLNTCYVKAKM